MAKSLEKSHTHMILPTAADQVDPVGHPFLAEGTPLAELLSWLRSLPDGRGDTYQFVRALRRTGPEGAPLTDGVRGPDAPDLTVVIAPSGHDFDALADTLACLGAQDFERFEVLIPAGPSDIGGLGELVEGLAGPLGRRVRLIPTGHDSANQSDLCLANLCLEAAGGVLVAPLAAGDSVTASWVRCFVEGAAAHPGAVVRARSVRSPTAPVEGLPECLAQAVPFTDEQFDLWRHLSADQLPLGSFALPTALCRHAGLRFDDHLPAPSWRFTFLAAMLAGVVDRADITCIHRLPSGEPVTSADDLAVALRDVPIHVPAGWVGRLQGDRNHLAYLTAELQATQDRLESVTRAHDSISGSRFWRITGPVRRVTGRWQDHRQP